MSLMLCIAVFLDLWLGEPKKYHPLVFFGNLANKVEAMLQIPAASPVKQRIMGLIALIMMVLPISLFIGSVCQWAWVNTLLSPIVLYFCIAAKSLRQHALNVYQALVAGDIVLARQQVGMIVSRDTEKMEESDIQKATVESVLENGADAIFAPIFWFMIGGAAGVVLYRLSNTLDAMWGYKNKRFIYFGWAAARFDDILNWIPARLTALSYALLGKTKQALACWKNQAHQLDSPNAGPVMTSGAGALGVSLGGSAWYHGKLKNKIKFGVNALPSHHDIVRANELISRTLILWVSFFFIFDFLRLIFA
jgi:adenosylcobinamide-phosphate synthase